MDSYKITTDTYNKIAEAYRDKFMDMDLYNDTYDRFCTLIDKPDAHIFEIGCGPGNITKYLLSQQPHFQITAIDTAPNMLALAQAHNPTARFELMDARDIHSLNTLFDGIICGFCLPYLSKTDCDKFFRDSAALLGKSGVLYVSAIEGDYNQSGYEAGSNGDRVYVYYHEAERLLASLADSGFGSIELIRKNYPMADGTNSVHLIILAQKMS